MTHPSHGWGHRFNPCRAHQVSRGFFGFGMWSACSGDHEFGGWLKQRIFSRMFGPASSMGCRRKYRLTGSRSYAQIWGACLTPVRLLQFAELRQGLLKRDPPAGVTIYFPGRWRWAGRARVRSLGPQTLRRALESESLQTALSRFAGRNHSSRSAGTHAWVRYRLKHTGDEPSQQPAQV